MSLVSRACGVLCSCVTKLNHCMVQRCIHLRHAAASFGNSVGHSNSWQDLLSFVHRLSQPAADSAQSCRRLGGQRRQPSHTQVARHDLLEERLC